MLAAVTAKTKQCFPKHHVTHIVLSSSFPDPFIASFCLHNSLVFHYSHLSIVKAFILFISFPSLTLSFETFPIFPIIVFALALVCPAMRTAVSKVYTRVTSTTQLRFSLTYKGKCYLPHIPSALFSSRFSHCCSSSLAR